MPWLIDGSNVLGAMRVDRQGEAGKRGLVRMLAQFARARRTRVTCIFDGHAPPSFASHLGSVTVAFSGERSADEVIVERAANGRGWNVVTSDRGLAARIQRREVHVVVAAHFLQQMEEASSGEESMSDDWDAYFSDPTNRLKF
jgi:predicted RNA-binding protein with PIN domain